MRHKYLSIIGFGILIGCSAVKAPAPPAPAAAKQSAAVTPEILGTGTPTPANQLDVATDSERAAAADTARRSLTPRRPPLGARAHAHTARRGDGRRCRVGAPKQRVVPMTASSAPTQAGCRTEATSSSRRQTARCEGKSERSRAPPASRKDG